MSNDETITTKYTYIKADDKSPLSKPVVYVFLSFTREVNGEECEELSQKYFETHNKMTLPGNPLIVDLRPEMKKASKPSAKRATRATRSAEQSTNKETKRTAKARKKKQSISGQRQERKKDGAGTFFCRRRSVKKGNRNE